MTFFDEAKSLVKRMVQPNQYEFGEIDDWISHCQYKHEGYDVEYNINEHGFRSDSFEGENGIVFLGCSLTYGYALQEWETWPWIVGKHFQTKVWNLSMTGHGDDASFIVAQKWIPKLKPKLVCMLTPPPGRYVFFHAPFEDTTLWQVVQEKKKKKIKYPFLFSKEQMYIQSLKNILAIKSICDSFEIPFISKSADIIGKDGLMKKFRKKIDMAKDGLHPGVKWQGKMANKFINQINKDKICI
tara:strand:+ start:371 stop:1096 length:726 start_codon:yes stop_codon:yes gene_type:complete